MSRFSRKNITPSAFMTENITTHNCHTPEFMNRDEGWVWGCPNCGKLWVKANMHWIEGWIEK